MTESVHGHEVLEMMLVSEERYTRESLLNAIAAKFGAGASFHTCSGGSMSAGELIDLLEAKGKIRRSGDYLAADAGNMCSH